MKYIRLATLFTTALFCSPLAVAQTCSMTLNDICGQCTGGLSTWCENTVGPPYFPTYTFAMSARTSSSCMAPGSA